MTLEVPQRIRQRLAAVMDDLKSAIGQEAAKAYLTSITTIESLVLEPEVELCDDSWMEYINEDCMTDASDLSYPMTCSPHKKIEEPFLQMTNSQTEADPYCPALSPQVANHVSPGKGTPAALCESCREPKKHHKRTSEYNTLDMVVQNLPRRNLLHCLKTHWDILKVEGIFAMPSRQVFTWTPEGNSKQVRRLHHHLILRHLDVEDDLHQWQRSIAEMRNLDGYTSFFAEAQAKQRIHKHTRQVEKATATRHTRNTSHISTQIGPRRITSA